MPQFNLWERVTSWARESTIHKEALDAEAESGLFAKEAKKGYNRYKVDDLTQYYDAYLNDDLVRAMVDDLVEAAFGNGYHFLANTVSEKTQHNKVKECVDEFGKHFRLDDFMPNILRNALIAGFCPVETVIESGDNYKDFSNCKLKIIRPDTIDRGSGKGIVANTDTFPPKILKIYQKVGSKEETITASGNKSIAWFVYGQLGNDVRGVSFVRGILNLLNTLNEATENVQKILDRYVAPVAVWKSEQNTEQLKQAVMGRKAGEDIYLGGLTPEEMASGVVEFHSIDPRVPFWDYLEYLDRRIWNYSRAANMYYMRNATQASIKILDGVITRHVTSIQRFARRGMENYWFRPICELFLKDEAKYDDVQMRFGAEKAKVEDIQLEGFLTAGIRYGIVPKGVYFKILKKLGVDIDLSEKEMEQLMKDNIQARANPQQSNQEPVQPQVTPGQDSKTQMKDKSFNEQKEFKMFYLKQCMDCGDQVKQSVVWEKKSDGLVYYAWFCDSGKCLSEWVKRREAVGDSIISIKPVLGGKVPEDFACYYSGYEAMEGIQKEAMNQLPEFMKIRAILNPDNTIDGSIVRSNLYYPDKNPIKKQSAKDKLE